SLTLNILFGGLCPTVQGHKHFRPITFYRQLHDTNYSDLRSDLSEKGMYRGNKKMQRMWIETQVDMK
ncbi:MAG: hypothetical protein KJO26_03775, partial [Deltaproteobacteria bacterium]|nr:hypothetical protein [Deltaproteobacteria bacterium]